MRRMRVAGATIVVAGAALAAWGHAGVKSGAADLAPVANVEAQSTAVAAGPDCTLNPIGPRGYDPNKQVFFGELHLHTGYSLDAFSFGTRTTPDMAYLYARNLGDIPLDPGRPPAEPAPPTPTVARIRALDFAALTDHSEFLSVVQGCLTPASGYYDEPSCVDVRSRREKTQSKIFPHMAGIVLDLCGAAADRPACVAQQQSAWLAIQSAATLAYKKCEFTTFVGYEWSDQVALQNGAATNHRNVIFKNEFVPTMPLNSVGYPTPPDLWNGLDTECIGECEAVTIPHNSNLSAGASLRVWDPSPHGIDQQRRYQVSAEIYQHKGASECHYDPATGFNEPECAFEQLNKALVDVGVSEASFVRYALGRGLEASLLAPSRNALKLGFVGGTDGHNGAPGNADEHAWRGHDAGVDSTPLKRVTDRIDWGPGGLTGVWAEENSRESIFAAIKRRETFATSGPRLKVRALQSTLIGACVSPGYPGNVLGTAVPMGGTITPAHLNGSPPTFLIEALPDGDPQALSRLPQGGMAQARLPKVQMIKIHTRLSGGLPVTVTEPPIDVIANANPASSYTPATGGCLSWTDRAFNPSEPSLYYVRVLQEPTRRWTYHDCVAIAATPEGVALGLTEPTCAAMPINSVEERAWSSPIWYEPPGLVPANPPTALVAAVTGSLVSLVWTPPAGASPLGYVLEAGSGPGLANIATLPLGAATSFSVNGVPAGAYWIRVRAANAFGASDPSNEVVVSVGGAPIPPNPPSGLAARVTARTVTLTWTAPAGGGTPEEYVVQAGTASGLSNVATSGTGQTATALIAPGVPPGTYFIRVRSKNSAGVSAPSNEVQVTVFP